MRTDKLYDFYNNKDNLFIFVFFCLHNKNLFRIYTLDRVLFKIFGALSKDIYTDICKYFCAYPI